MEKEGGREKDSTEKRRQRKVEEIKENKRSGKKEREGNREKRVNITTKR